jgi:iron(III) transport system permease protein
VPDLPVILGHNLLARYATLGAWRYVTCGLSLLLVFLITGLPFLVMLYSSLLRRYQAPTTEAFASMSLGNYQAIFQGSFLFAHPDVQ